MGVRDPVSLFPSSLCRGQRGACYLVSVVRPYLWAFSQFLQSPSGTRKHNGSVRWPRPVGHKARRATLGGGRSRHDKRRGRGAVSECTSLNHAFYPDHRWQFGISFSNKNIDRTQMFRRFQKKKKDQSWWSCPSVFSIIYKCYLKMFLSAVERGRGQSASRGPKPMCLWWK